MILRYITRKLERALKRLLTVNMEITMLRYITRKLERALKRIKLKIILKNRTPLYNP